jgi:hypothetical protein
MDSWMLSVGLYPFFRLELSRRVPQVTSVDNDCHCRGWTFVLVPVVSTIASSIGRLGTVCVAIPDRRFRFIVLTSSFWRLRFSICGCVLVVSLVVLGRFIVVASVTVVMGRRSR